MPDILIQPNADADDDLSNAIVMDDTTLPLSSQGAVALGLTLGTTYKARVLGVVETFSVAVPATAPAQMSAPTVTATGENSISVDLAAAPADGGSAITSYDLRYSTDETNWTEVSDVSDPATVSGLTASTLYYVQTRAVNAVNADPSNWSTSGTATTDAAAAGYLDDFTSYSEGDDPSVDNPSNYTAVGTSIAGTAYVNATLNELTWHPTNTSSVIGTWWTYTGSTLSDDHFVEAVIGSETGHADQYGPYIEFFVRFVDADNHIRMALYSNKDQRLVKRVGGTDTINLEFGAQTALNEDDVVKVEVIGDTVKRYRDGVEVGSYTHADLDTGGALASGVTGMRYRRLSASAPAYLAPISLKSVEFGDA